VGEDQREDYNEFKEVDKLEDEDEITTQPPLKLTEMVLRKPTKSS